MALLIWLHGFLQHTCFIYHCACCSILLGYIIFIILCAEKTISDNDIEALKNEYQNLTNLLLQESEIKLTTLLGEGMNINCC